MNPARSYCGWAIYETVRCYAKGKCRLDFHLHENLRTGSLQSDSLSRRLPHRTCLVVVVVVLLLLLLLLVTAVGFYLSGSSLYTSTDKTNTNIHKLNFTKTLQTIQNIINTSTHITRTATRLSKHPHIH